VSAIERRVVSPCSLQMVGLSLTNACQRAYECTSENVHGTRWFSDYAFSTETEMPTSNHGDDAE
jgi:hypothetical protein